MAIVTTPSSIQLKQPARCVICSQKVSIANLTAGLTDTVGEQQFACFGHTWDSSKYIIGWAKFMSEGQYARQRERPAQINGIYVERRPATGNEVLSWDIAHHLFTRQFKGKIVILTDDPTSALSTVRKQWVKVTRKVQRERSTTLDMVLIKDLSAIIAHMQNLTFTTRNDYDQPDADVYIFSDYQQIQDCTTLYITQDTEEDALRNAAAHLPPSGLLVFYK